MLDPQQILAQADKAGIAPATIADLNDTIRYEEQLHRFIKAAWKIIEPTTQYVNSWHIELIAEYLQACTLGQIRRLMITVPPRNSKSIPTSIMWPCWSWIKKPESRWIFTSYSKDLSTEHSLKRRKILESDWYSARWGNIVKMRDDRNLLDHYENTRGGVHRSTSMNSAVAGFGCEYLVCDDAHDTTKTESDAERMTVLQSFDLAFSTRLNNPRTGVIVIIQQRVHVKDLVGHCLELGYEHLRLPMVAEEPARIVFPLSGRVVERKEGDLLNPKREGEEAVEEHRRTLGSRGFAGQYQQSPVPLGGNIFKSDWFKTYRTLPPKFERTIMSLDTAFKTKQENDWSVITVWGAYQGHFFLLHVNKTKVEFGQLKQLTVAEWQRWERPDTVLIEDKASGISLIQELRMPINFNGISAQLPIVPIKIDTDKVARAQAAAPMVESGQVWLPDATVFNVPWLATFLTDVTTFPAGEGADTMDATSQFLNYMRGGGMWSGLMQYQQQEIARMKASLEHRPRCVNCGQLIADNLAFTRSLHGAQHAQCPAGASIAERGDV